MFSQFKKALQEGLNELDKLAEANPQQQLQQHGRLSGHRVHSENGSLSAAAAAAEGRSSAESSMGRRSPNSSNGAGVYAAGGGRGGAAAASLSSSSSVQERPTSAIAAASPSATATVGAAASPLAMPPSSNSNASANNPSDNSFPNFGLGGVRRSLSHLPRTSLDLGSLRPSFDATTMAAGPLTPSREGRELPDWTFSPSSASAAKRPSTPGGTSSGSNSNRPRRRGVVRAASISGPFTPDTMTKMDPFFFTSLQGLSDELKIAAFTPLPKEDADEELDQIDQELNPSPPAHVTKQFNPLQITLPQIITSNLTQSDPPGFRPSSAPAAGPAQSFGQNLMQNQNLAQLARSPLAETARRSMLQQSLHDHAEVDEDDHEHDNGSSSLFSHTPEMTSAPVDSKSLAGASTATDEEAAEETRQAAPPSDITEASPAPVFDDLPDVSNGSLEQPVLAEEVAEVRPVPYGRLSASSTPRRGRSPSRPAEQREASPAPAIARIEEILPKVKVEGPATPQPAPEASAAEASRSSFDRPMSRSVSPTPTLSASASGLSSAGKTSNGSTVAAAKLHEPLAARLARISRAASPLHNNPVPASSDHATSAHASEQSARTSGASSPKLPSTATAGSREHAVDAVALEILLRRYIPSKNALDLSSVEQYLESKSRSAPGNLAVAAM